jgi:hypothetical protein
MDSSHTHHHRISANMCHVSSAPRRRRRAFAGVALATILILGALVDGELRHTTVLGRSTQPATVRYPDQLRYDLAVVKVQTFLIRRDRPYELWTGRGPQPSYGHVHSFQATKGSPVIADVHWRPEGVRVRFTSGQELFVPAKSFMGGR